MGSGKLAFAKVIKKSFPDPFGKYVFNRLPYALSNSPSGFQRLMDIVLKNVVGTECFVFIDDVTIFSKSAQEHDKQLENVLERFL
jgi:hypothetical protein